MREAKGDDDLRRRQAKNRRLGLARLIGAGLVLTLLAVPAFRLTLEVDDRRRERFCRPDHGIAGATAFEKRTWWPLGERCFLRLADGSTRVRESSWSLTVLATAWSAVVLVGAVAPPQSTRRRLAWTAVVPAVPVAALILATVGPRSLSRLVALTSISLGFGSFMASITAAVVWYVMRGRLLPTALASWFVWSVLVFLQGKEFIGP